MSTSVLISMLIIVPTSVLSSVLMSVFTRV